MKSLSEYIVEAEQDLAEKAKSSQQQKFFGMVHAMQKGKKIPGASPELKKVAHAMGKKDVEDYAKTKHKGLPKRVGEQQVNEIDIDTLNQLASHAVNTLGQGVANFAAGATGGLVGGAIAGGTKKAVDWYYKQKQKKAGAKRKKSQQQGMAEGLSESVLTDSTGSGFDHILKTFSTEVREFKKTGELDSFLYDALFDYYLEDMPYGIAKARTGDPHDWVSDRFGQELSRRQPLEAAADLMSTNPVIEEPVVDPIVEEPIIEEPDSTIMDLRQLAGLPPR